MNKEFTNYLKNIGMTNALIGRVEDIYNFYHDVSSEEILDIFVDDFINGDGSREYESVWFFSKSNGMEAKSFITQDDFDNTPILKRVTYWSIEKQEYDFKKATDKSRLHIEITLAQHIEGDFKASKENCDYLKEIFMKYILPNLIN